MRLRVLSGMAVNILWKAIVGLGIKELYIGRGN